MRTRHLFTLSAIVSALIAPSLAAQAAPDLDRSPAQVMRAESGRPLAVAGQVAPEASVRQFLRSQGRADAVLASLRVARRGGGANGLTHLRLEQAVAGLAVHGAYVKAAFNARGELVHLIDKSVAISTPSSSRVDAKQALVAAMARVHPRLAASFRNIGIAGATTRFDGGAVFHRAPEVTAVVVPMSDGTLARGWLVETWTEKDNLLHHTLIGGDGRVLDIQLRTASDSYNVFAEDPLKNAQAVVEGPGAGNDASPAGWLAGRLQLSTRIKGNNVFAYLDTDNNNGPDRGGSFVFRGNFLAPSDLNAAPSTAGNKAVAVQNLFYLNNVIHDILYRKGFDEAASNFQQDNFGKGGLGADPVQAEAQDGGGLNNANFSTPPDGNKPRMQMYLWSGVGATHEVQVNGGATYGAMGAQFGPAMTTSGVTGVVALADDGTNVGSDACEPVGAGVAGKLALVDRGTCAFTVKARNVQEAGAIGMIVANNVGTVEILAMGGTDPLVTIPSVMIGLNDGAALRSLPTPTATMRAKAVEPLQIDASLDSDVVFHEYGHGLTWRMIGNMSGPLSGAIGEGMSDGLAMLINGDDRVGEYSTSNPVGIRSAPYTNYGRTYGDVAGTGVHFDGEVYAAIVWRMMELFHGQAGEIGVDRLFGHVVSGMNFTPAGPAYEHMRDGILAAVANSATPADCSLVWQAFSAFGVGQGAQGIVNGNGSVSITESFSAPATCN